MVEDDVLSRNVVGISCWCCYCGCCLRLVLLLLLPSSALTPVSLVTLVGVAVNSIRPRYVGSMFCVGYLVLRGAGRFRVCAQRRISSVVFYWHVFSDTAVSRHFHHSGIDLSTWLVELVCFSETVCCLLAFFVCAAGGWTDGTYNNG